MIDKNFDPWKRVREFNPEALLQESSDLVQWPIKLYKAPKLSPTIPRRPSAHCGGLLGIFLSGLP